MQSLLPLGWNEFFTQQLTPEEQQNETLGESRFARVSEVQRGRYRLLNGGGEFWAECTGRLRHETAQAADLPAVGDWVEFRPNPGGDATLLRRLERQSILSRRDPQKAEAEQLLVANLDLAMVVTSLNQDLNLRRIERYLTVLHEQHIKPLLLLSKADLVEPEAAAAAQAAVESVAGGVPVLILSAREGRGREELAIHLGAGITCVLIGSSGAGKSTLLNWLAGAELQTVREIRAGDDRGQHTTTARRLVPLPSGALLIDTPGLRTVRLWEVGEGLNQAFTEIAALDGQCRFRDCAHGSEPGCAIRTALDSGGLDAARYANYKKMEREAEFQSRRHDLAAQSIERSKWRRIHRAQSDKPTLKRQWRG